MFIEQEKYLWEAQKIKRTAITDLFGAENTARNVKLAKEAYNIPEKRKLKRLLKYRLLNGIYILITLWNINLFTY